MKLFLKLAACAAFFASCAPAYAQSLPDGCLERGLAIETLHKNQAQLSAMGLAENGMAVQVWLFPNGNWLVIIDNGLALCIAANGTDWRTFPTGEAT